MVVRPVGFLAGASVHECAPSVIDACTRPEPQPAFGRRRLARVAVSDLSGAYALLRQNVGHDPEPEREIDPKQDGEERPPEEAIAPHSLSSPALAARRSDSP